MYLKSIIIDGFKSYGRRTEIRDFDPEFTAITGLNGTGKSNILDSICFVLGISNLGQVRATSLQDLVFKGGQAGITKATVTLFFDNTDQGQCPLGYEKCREISVTRQIVVGGKNKYMINGKNVQNKKVADLFCSVQLNVNNPNFLIMQGRITKVLNMKPHEILSMVEEAAGTSMYESKKEATTKLIEKKDAKVKETNTLLKEEVEPRLEKLRTEHAAYQEFQKTVRDIEYLTRIHVSFKYLKYKESLATSEKNVGKISEIIESHKNNIIDNNADIKKCEEMVLRLQNKIDSDTGGELKEIEEKLSEKTFEEAKATGKIKAAEGAIVQEKKQLDALKKSIQDDIDALRDTETKMIKAEDLFKVLKEQDEHDTKSYVEAQNYFKAVTQGLSKNEEGEATSLQDQLILSKKLLSEAQTAIKTVGMELKHSEDLLKQKQSETQLNDSSYLNDKKLHDNIESEIQKIKAVLSKIQYKEGDLEELEQRRGVLTQEIRSINNQLDRGNACLYTLQYRDPEPNFNRSKVRGMVGKLFDVSNQRDYLALTMCAGGSLYSFVVDDDITSKKILQKGQLQNRVTIIPINKITSHPVSQSVIKTAENLVGAENVQSALSLIEYDNYYNPVMKFVFGHTLICKDMDIAKQVTFHKNILCRSVTLDGDVLDPEGTLSGGARPKGVNILEDLAKIKKLEKELVNITGELAEIQKKISQVKDTANNFSSLKRNLELRQHELQACAQRLTLTAFHQTQVETENLKRKISSLQEDLCTAGRTRDNASNRLKILELKLVDAEGNRDRELKIATEQMKAAKKRTEESNLNWKKREQEFETLKLEIEEIKRSKEVSELNLNKMAENLKKLQDNLSDFVANSKLVSDEIIDLKEKIQTIKENINSQNKELKLYMEKKYNVEKQNQEFVLDIKKKENDLNRVRSDCKDVSGKVYDLEKKYGWIKEDLEFFGIKNTRYDYSREDPVEAGRKLSKAKEQKEAMERNINLKAMMLLDREEEQYKETIRKKKIVEEDKEKIKHIICRMDEKKREKVEKAWKIVNDNFSGIFSSLLPGAAAELKPSFINHVLVGLEIKVGFNGIWKESLGELSGGQRSLVALSLVLAMLKFCPAPLYILDEVDAALDMSHTQNIGSMFKTYFTNSQFIIVSLKDGMFNNANVLFKTRFEEGVSAVARTDNRRLKK